MSKVLPINLDDLLSCRVVESERVEFKGSWNLKTTGPEVLRTICAFANDLHNLNGGYVVIGVEERAGRAVLPPPGLTAIQVDAARQWIRDQCKGFDPSYQPILTPEAVSDRTILVVWAPASDTRPHRIPSDTKRPSRYWVRIGSETVDVEQRDGLLGDLISQTAEVPWDDRHTHGTTLEDLSEFKVREHLRDIQSGLLDESNTGEIYRRMRISTQIKDHEVPRNAALLLFSRNPSHWFRGAKIEVVQFAADRVGDVQEERTFGGGLVDQLRDCLTYLENFSAFHLQKQRNQSQVRSWSSYPLSALRETLVNAVYHRGYDVDQPEPTKVYVYPSRIDVISYPGPVPGIDHRHFESGARAPAAPARNRRIGEFLKELGLAEGRLSGLPKIFQAMEENGSPKPFFDFDEQRTYFQATLPAHPEYIALSAVRDAGHLRALGEHKEASRRIQSAWETNQNSPVLAAEMVRILAEKREIGRAESVFRTFVVQGSQDAISQVENALIKALLDSGYTERALEMLRRDRPALFGQDAIDSAVLARRAGDALAAHRCFERAGDAIFADPHVMLEFAQTKLRLAQMKDGKQHQLSNRHLLNEARSLLNRVTQLDSSRTCHAWAWREMGRTLECLGAPVKDARAAYSKAIELLPDEPRFIQEMEETLNRLQ